MRLALVAALLAGACASASAQIAPLPPALCAGWQGERVCELLHEDAMVRVLLCRAVRCRDGVPLPRPHLPLRLCFRRVLRYASHASAHRTTIRGTSS